MEQDLFIIPSTETTEAPSKTIYSSLLLLLNVPQAFSVGQIQLINGWFTGSGSKPYLEKSVSYLPCQGEKGPKTTSCVFVPLLATLVWVLVAKCNFRTTAGSVGVVGGHRRTRRDRLYRHKGNSKGLPLITVKTGANHFPSVDFCFSAKLWPFYCCHASPNRASIICLYGLSVFSWDPDKRLSGAWMAALFPCSEEILGKCSQAPSLGGGRKKNNSGQVCSLQNHSWILSS